MYRLAPVSTRGLPIRFEEVSRVQKPSRKAKPEAWQAYREAIKHHNLSRRFVETMGQLRLELDLAGGEKKILVLAVDGSFCNRTCLRAPRDRTELIARARKDAVLCARAAEGSRRFYNTEKFTPEQVRQDAAQPWKQTKVFYGASGAKYATKRWLQCTGKAVQADALCACWWWRRLPIANAKAANCTIENQPSC